MRWCGPRRIRASQRSAPWAQGTAVRPLSLESGGTAPALIAARRAAQDLQFCLLGGVFALLDCLYFFGVR